MLNNLHLAEYPRCRKIYNPLLYPKRRQIRFIRVRRRKAEEDWSHIAMLVNRGKKVVGGNMINAMIVHRANTCHTTSILLQAALIVRSEHTIRNLRIQVAIIVFTENIKMLLAKQAAMIVRRDGTIPLLLIQFAIFVFTGNIKMLLAKQVVTTAARGNGPILALVHVQTVGQACINMKTLRGERVIIVYLANTTLNTVKNCKAIAKIVTSVRIKIKMAMPAPPPPPKFALRVKTVPPVPTKINRVKPVRSV